MITEFQGLTRKQFLDFDHVLATVPADSIKARILLDSGALKYIVATMGLLFENIFFVSGLSLGKPGLDYFGPKRPLLNCCKLPGIDFFCHPFLSPRLALSRFILQPVFWQLTNLKAPACLNEGHLNGF